MKINIKKFKTVKSTNDIAIKLIQKNYSEPTLITCEKQTKGRGRMGKKWISEKGNLFFTIFFKLEKKNINFKQFSILNAMLIKHLISKKFTQKIKIKWPNDLLFKERKFCGILQELVKFNQFDYLIVGIGINTNKASQNKDFQSTCLKNIVNKRISNQVILKNILTIYGKFLNETKKMSFTELKRKYR